MKVPKARTAHGAPTCGAAKRADGVAGQPCRNPAGFKTGHVGVGRCFLHGGRNPVTHGRYSGVTRENVRGLIDQHASDPNPLDTLPELAAARALFQDYLERYDETTAALLAWHESYQRDRKPMPPEDRHALQRVLSAYEADRADDAATGTLPDAEKALCDAARRALDWLDEGEQAIDGKPRQILDLSDAVRHAAEITKMVERVERARAANAVSRADFLRVLTEMSRVVESFNDEPDAAHRLDKIKHGWTSIRLG